MERPFVTSHLNKCSFPFQKKNGLQHFIKHHLLLYAGENVVMNEKEKTPNFDHVSNRIPKIEVEIKLKWAR